MWCEVKRRRLSADELAPLVVEAIVRAVIARDYLADPEKFEKFFLREICAQLDDSKDPDQLLKKWEQAIVHRRPEDLPHVDLARLGGEVVAEIGSEVVAEMRRQLVDSKNPEKLIKKWGRAVWDQRFEDLPHVM
jgi:hypothetical protein